MEYRSKASFLGLPLVHVATGGHSASRYRRGVASAWFAIGDIAMGVVFACGGIAIGDMSVGGVVIGILPFGGIALGLLAIGGLAFGIMALGGAAFASYAAVGGLALARNDAMGGCCIGTERHPAALAKVAAP